jgi:hypothetical protein
VHVWRGRLKSEAVKYYAEDRVQENKMANGLIRNFKG